VRPPESAPSTRRPSLAPDHPDVVGDPRRYATFRRVLGALHRASAPFLVGGGWAMKLLADIRRPSPDLDVFTSEARLDDVARPLREAGLRFEIVFPHWLGKIHDGDVYVDLIFNSGNGVAAVDEAWFAHASDAVLFDVPVRLVPPEEMIWSKAFVMERERCDVADVAHLLRATAARLDWPRLLYRFGAHWRVLLAHLVLFGFVYPGANAQVPAWVIEELGERLRRESLRGAFGTAEEGAHAGLVEAEIDEALCQGTLLSREQFLVDLERWGLRDARLPPTGTMRSSQVERWTAAIPSGRRDVG
jgi:hypothetical protein